MKPWWFQCICVTDAWCFLWSLSGSGAASHLLVKVPLGVFDQIEQCVCVTALFWHSHITSFRLLIILTHCTHHLFSPNFECPCWIIFWKFTGQHRKVGGFLLELCWMIITQHPDLVFSQNHCSVINVPFHFIKSLKIIWKTDLMLTKCGKYLISLQQFKHLKWHLKRNDKWCCQVRSLFHRSDYFIYYIIYHII